MKRCAVILHECNMCRLSGEEGHWVVDCEQHEHSYDTPMFADAVAEAMIHRFEATR